MLEARQLTTFAFCCRVERRDGAGFAVTSHDQGHMADGIWHEPAPGMMPKSVVRSLDPAETGTELEGSIDNSSFHSDDLLAGRWNGASTQLAAVSWDEPESRPIVLSEGGLGEVSVEGLGFSAELTGLAEVLAAPPCPVTSPECRAELGDAACCVDMRGRSMQMRVVAVAGDRVVLSGEVPQRFRFGWGRWLSGRKAGLRSFILMAEGNAVAFRERPRLGIAIGDGIELQEGCDKRLSTCAERFHNAVNFRGEPHLPGNDLLARY